MHYLGVFLQDNWKVSQKLTLNLGVRYEVESALKQNDNCGLDFNIPSATMLVSKDCINLPVIQNFYRDIRPDVQVQSYEHRAPYNADTNNLAPRIGFAYRLRQQTVVRGGYGIYYDSPQIQSLASTNDFAPNTLRPIWTSSPTVPEFGYNPEGNTAAAEATIGKCAAHDLPVHLQEFSLR